MVPEKNRVRIFFFLVPKKIMFRTITEAEGEDLDPVNWHKPPAHTPYPTPSPSYLLLAVPRRYFFCDSSMSHVVM